MKLKDKIRDKLKNWLLKDELNEIKNIKTQYKSIQNQFIYANAALGKAQDEYSHAYKLVDDCHKLINSITDVGTDVGFHSDDHSWAVVCIQGHPEYVKFLPLSRNDARDVIKFLRCFEYSNKIVDSPFAFKDMMKHYIVDNPF